ncbi:hypothetical protein ASG40_03060 [Methylobacterium sp. Leaf399]|uniref:caspase family protein n=1 Tax=Methylobacterium sp. Leaf399 TaxID=1736364 RepID=UPI0007004F4D|nr:caspase family protein [Methylobacterium sp. Leaf399]KQT19810.1 hypothetical protein ASG40_03060 [Methylobacterium sp. Leaf399]
MKKVLPALFVLLLTMWASAAVAQTQTGKRVALIIGNAAYASFGKLDNPSNDAEDIAAVLRQIGFTVIEGRDLSKRDMDRRLAQFSRAASDAETAVVYYAGHGLQYQNQNFLVPTDAQLKDGFDIPFETISVDSVIGALDNSRGARIMILDACRNLPLTEGVKRGSGTGLARVVGRDGLIIAYATQSNQVAFDGQGRNSPYAEALAKSLAESGLEVGQVFQRVAVAVKKATQGKQLPEFSRSYADEVFLNRAETDSQAWSRLRNSNVVADLSAFIEKFPASFLADAARIRIQLLENQARYAEQEAENRRQEERRAHERQLWARREEEQNHREQARLSMEKSRREEEQNQAELARLMAQRQDEEARREAIRREERARQEQARLDAEKAARLAAAEILRREEAARLARQEQAKAEAEKAARLAAAEQKRRDEAARVEQARIEAEKAAQFAAAEQARRDEAARVELARQEQARIDQARADAEKAARLAALEQKRRDEAARIEQVKIEQARVEAEKAARLAALEQARRDEIARQEQAKAEKAAQVAAAQVAAAERQRREDAARLDQVKAEAARVAAAEQQRRDEAARQEQARAEQARIEQSKAEQARIEQARADAERAARLAAIEQTRREEAARVAAAEQSRREETARADQLRIASEAAAQVAAVRQEQVRQEQARLAADAEVVRMAAVVDSRIAAVEPVAAAGGFALSMDAAKAVVAPSDRAPADRAPASQADTAKLPHTAYASLDLKEIGDVKATVPGNPGEVQRAVQRRLTELGCYTEPPEASWGRHSMAALDRFYAAAKRADRAKTDQAKTDQAKTDQAKTDQAKAELTGNGPNRSIRIASTLPDQLTLDDLNGYSGRICPMICPTGSEQQGEVCVKVTCPNGTVLSDSVCLPRKAAPVAVDPAPRIRKAARPAEIEEDVRPARKVVAPPVEREVRRPAPREVVRPAPREAARPAPRPTYKIVAPVRAAPKVPALSTYTRSAPVRATASSAPSVTPAEIGAVRAMSRMP